MPPRKAGNRLWISGRRMLAWLLMLAACTGDSCDEETTEPELTPEWELEISPPFASVDPGRSTSFDLTVTTTEHQNFGAVVVSGAPAGVTVTKTATDTDPSGHEQTSTYTVSVDPNTAPGSYEIILTHQPDNQTEKFILTVPPKGLYLGARPTGVSVTQDAGPSPSIEIAVTRTGGFEDPVTFDLASAPLGLTASFSQHTSLGDTFADVTFSATAAVPPGQVTVTIRARGPGGTPSATVQVVVTVDAATPPSSNVFIDLSGWEPQVLWAGFANGSGPFAQVPIVNGVAQAAVTAATGIFAFASTIPAAPFRGASNVAAATAATYQVTVYQLTKAELTSGVIRVGFRRGNTTLSGNVAGISSGKVAQLVWGNAEAFLNSSTPAFSMTNSTAGPHSLAGMLRNAIGGVGASDRVFMRQNQVSASGVNVDFNGAESAPVATATATLGGLIAGDQVTAVMAYTTEPTCEGTVFYGMSGGSSFTIAGMPSSLQGANDMHIFTFQISNGASVLQQTFFSKTLAGFAGTRPPPLATPTVTNVAGAPYTRKQAQVTLGTYNAINLFYGDATHSVSVTATRGYIGGGTGTVTAPDLSGAAGWNNGWAPPPGVTGWSVGASTTTAVGPECTNGTIRSVTGVSGNN